MTMLLDPRDDHAEPRLRAASGGCARWIGASGKRYSAEIYPLGFALPAGPGVFILAKQRGPLAQSWVALFVGSDANAAAAIGDARRHLHLWNFAVELGLTAIHLVTAAAGAAERHDIARDLIRSLLPSLNRETAAMQRFGGVGTNLGVTT
ncbi:MAG: hypothetical protein ACREIP_06630 [Alphaproteobacteria bacterium]